MGKLFTATCLTITAIALTGISAKAQLFPNLGGQRAGISALTFLKNDLSPRSVGMGGANVSLPADNYSINNNPALASEIRETGFAASYLHYANSLNHNLLSATIPLKDNSTVIASVHNLSSGAMPVRTEFQPDGTGEYFYVTNLAAGVGYSRAISERFSFGLYAKYIHESLAEYSMSTVGVDMGFLYRTDFQHLRFAAVLQNFGTNSGISGTAKPITYNNGNAITIDNYPPPTTFKMGISMNVLEAADYYLAAAIQVNHPSDNAENIRLGAEFGFGDRFFARAGYKINVLGEKLPTGGVGVKFNIGNMPFHVDYGVYPSDYLGVYHAVGISCNLPRKTATDDTATPPAQ